jgi:hypothetical protein
VQGENFASSSDSRSAVVGDLDSDFAMVELAIEAKPEHDCIGLTLLPNGRLDCVKRGSATSTAYVAGVTVGMQLTHYAVGRGPVTGDRAKEALQELLDTQPPPALLRLGVAVSLDVLTAEFRTSVAAADRLSSKLVNLTTRSAQDEHQLSAGMQVKLVGKDSVWNVLQLRGGRAQLQMAGKSIKKWTEIEEVVPARVSPDGEAVACRLKFYAAVQRSEAIRRLLENAELLNNQPPALKKTSLEQRDRLVAAKKLVAAKLSPRLGPRLRQEGLTSEDVETAIDSVLSTIDSVEQLEAAAQDPEAIVRLLVPSPERGSPEPEVGPGTRPNDLKAELHGDDAVRLIGRWARSNAATAASEATAVMQLLESTGEAAATLSYPELEGLLLRYFAVVAPPFSTTARARAIIRSFERRAHRSSATADLPEAAAAVWGRGEMFESLAGWYGVDPRSNPTSWLRGGEFPVEVDSQVAGTSAYPRVPIECAAESTHDVLDNFNDDDEVSFIFEGDDLSADAPPESTDGSAEAVRQKRADGYINMAKAYIQTNDGVAAARVLDSLTELWPHHPELPALHGMLEILSRNQSFGSEPEPESASATELEPELDLTVTFAHGSPLGIGLIPNPIGGTDCAEGDWSTIVGTLNKNADGSIGQAEASNVVKPGYIVAEVENYPMPGQSHEGVIGAIQHARSLGAPMAIKFLRPDSVDHLDSSEIEREQLDRRREALQAAQDARDSELLAVLQTSPVTKDVVKRLSAIAVAGSDRRRLLRLGVISFVISVVNDSKSKVRDSAKILLYKLLNPLEGRKQASKEVKTADSEVSSPDLARVAMLGNLKLQTLGLRCAYGAIGPQTLASPRLLVRETFLLMSPCTHVGSNPLSSLFVSSAGLFVNVWMNITKRKVIFWRSLYSCKSLNRD